MEEQFSFQKKDAGSIPVSPLHIPIRAQENPCAFDFKGAPGVGLYIAPTTLRKANDFVACYHRHTGRTSRNGGKFAISLCWDGGMVGVAILGNPLSATLMDGTTAEILRVCVNEGLPKGSCSRLYAACWRAWRAMGGRRLVTYTLESEDGASLRGAGWKLVGKTKPTGAGWRKTEDNCTRTFAEVLTLVKVRWEITGTPSK